jgi:hypothetical protein
MSLISPDFLPESALRILSRRVSGGLANTHSEGLKMAKTTKAQTKDQRKLGAEGNRYTRAARVLAKNDTIDVKTLADRAFMSETTAERCLEAWNACVAALIDVGRLPDPAKAAAKKATPKPKAATVETPAAAETPPA